VNEYTKPTFFYGYIIVAAAFIILLLMWGTLRTFGVFLNPMSTELGWTRAMVSGSPAICSLVIGLFAIIAGRLNDRFGPRLVVSISGLVMGVGYLLMSRMNTIWQFYLFYGVLIGLGLGGPNIALSSTVVRWFVKKRGTMSGIVQAGSGVGMLIMPLVANQLILVHGWRTSYMLLALIVFVFIVSASLFLKLDPSRMGLQPDGGIKKKGDLNLKPEGSSFQEAIYAKQFWLVSMAYFLFLFCVTAIMVHLYPHAEDLDIPRSIAAKILAMIGGISIIGRFFIGSIGDKVGHRLAVIINLSVLALSFLWLLIAKEIWMLYVFAGLFGIAQGGLYTVIAPLVADLFGVRSHGTIFGAVNLSGSLGGAFGPFMAGYIFDKTDSYQPAFFIFIIACIAALFSTMSIKSRQ